MPEKATGFASPAQGYEKEGIDLNRLLIRNPSATIYVRLGAHKSENFATNRRKILQVRQAPSQ
jgi:hypothetical protein